MADIKADTYNKKLYYINTLVDGVSWHRKEKVVNMLVFYLTNLYWVLTRRSFQKYIPNVLFETSRYNRF